MSEPRRVAVVTGANRGLGIETCRQLAKQGLRVVLTSRDEGKGRKAAKALQGEGLEVSYHQLDVTDTGSAERLARDLKKEHRRADVLVNNAGVYLDRGDPGWAATASIATVRIETLRQTMETNVYGALRVTREIVPLMRERGYGRIVNVSSGMGQLTEMNGGYPAYRISKTSLNALTRILSEELKGTDILVNSVCPGWVRTDMGGAEAPRTPEQGADTIVWLATLPAGGPTGGFFRDRKPIPW
jgi:NAD(P)-dependent dehydrogenase (short-subunit alcohol dehydrogenase family)